ncbi:death-associated protein kinase dapk-1-like [Branchiostoma floridae]|uniref:Death-associated protein kinase dapk-1-like n=1 Tax=Branchiostoma floridae TaxID=7739 RepID=A0A9J7L8I6_BRAFL|nr:death-associated protein kinase dapk-1-like [Branchiostoma floridae]
MSIHTTQDQSTPLHYAAARGNTGTCEVLIRAGADVTATDKEGKTPLDYARDPEILRHWKNLDKQVKQEKSYHELLQMSGGVKVNRFKVFVGGNETNGKSTLKQSLTKGLLSAVMQRLSLRSGDAPYNRTPGVDIGTFQVPGVGEVSVWDFAGQAEYAVTHNMFMDSENTVFIVLYNIKDDKKNQQNQVHWWLCFIKSCNPNRQPDVILVASHADKVEPATGHLQAALVVQTMKAEFKDHLRIADEVILMDCRKTWTPEMDQLKTLLVKIGEEMLQHQRDMPRLCAKIMEHLPKWCKKTSPKFPVMMWPDYVREARKLDRLVTEDFLKKSSRFLHHLAEVLLISLATSDPIIVLKPNWLGTDVFGKVMAPDFFDKHLNRTSEDYVTKAEIERVFQDVADVDLVIALLQEFQLCHTFDEETYIIPGLLKQNMPDKVWKPTTEQKVVYFGKQVQCADKTDMFSSGFFPQVQTRLMRQLKYRPSLWRDGAKCVDRDVEGLIKLSPDGRAVSICVRSVQGDKVQCGKMLQKLKNIIADVLYECSPGTGTVERVLSARALKEHREEFYSYGMEEISEAIAKGVPVAHPILKFTEEVSKLLSRDEDPELEGSGAAAPPSGGGEQDSHSKSQTSHQITTAPHGSRTKAPMSLQGLKVPKVLLINDEYGTSKGGISTVNCQVGQMLFEANAVVYCTALLVPKQDQEAADRDGVQLIGPDFMGKTEPTLDWLTYYHSVHFPDLPKDVTCIIGHADITDTAARNIWDQRYPQADLVTINHVLPEDTDYYKGGRKAMKAGEKVADMLDKSNNAKAAFSVGKRIYDDFDTKYKGEKKPQSHHIFLPKPSKMFLTINVRPEGEQKVVLSIGRVRKVEKLKGHDLIALTMREVVKVIKNARWCVRGINEGDFEAIKKILEKSGYLNPILRPYGTQEDIRNDMMTAHLVLMPSRSEPFGLVGLEAIAAGIPVLISDKTGLAEMILDLIEQGKLHADHKRVIVETNVNDTDPAGDVSRWADRIVDILKNTDSEFEKAAQFKQELVESRYWEESHRTFLQVCGITAVQ